MLASLPSPMPALVAFLAAPRAAPAAGRSDGGPFRAVPAALAFGLLCLWIGATPRTLAGLLGADGVDFDVGR